MPRAICPVCKESISLTAEEAHVGARVICPNCGAELRVTNTKPRVRLARVLNEDDEASEEDDEYPQ